MSDLDLTAFVQEITKLRDTAFQAALDNHKAGLTTARATCGAEWFNYARTLSVLHRCTEGRYGTPIDDQASPYQAIAADGGVR